MTGPAPIQPSERPWIQRNALRLLSAVLLLVVALTPAEVSWAFAIGDALLLWVLFSIPLLRTMAGTGTGGEKVLFGGMAILLGAVGALLLVGLACIRPLSKMNL